MTSVETAWEYEEQIINGDIKACDALIAQCKRNKKDRKRKKFDFEFNEKIANAVCDFFPAFLKHSIGRHQGQPFELLPFQKWILCQLFGWQKKDGSGRRFNKTCITVARKNGKSTFVAGLAMFMAGFDLNPVTKQPESVAQILLAATKLEQSRKVIFAECSRMRQQSPMIKNACDLKNNQITFNHNGGHIMCVASDKPLDGFNSSMTVIDELHSFSNTDSQRQFVDTLKTGSGARSQPIAFYITTAGSDKSLLWKEQHGYAKDVAKGTVKDDSFLPVVYEIEVDKGLDPLCEDNWIMSNPGLGETVSFEYLREQALPATRDRQSLRRFQRYHANFLVSSTESAFDIDEWDACEGELSDWSTADACCFGLDLGGRDDLAAYAAVARFPVNDEDDEGRPVYRYEIQTWQCIVKDTQRDLNEEPFSSFIEDGWLEVVSHPVKHIEEGVEHHMLEYKAEEIACDPYNASRSIERFDELGMNVITFSQSATHFHEPISELLAAIRDGRVTHEGDPLLRWCVRNAVTESDRFERLRFNKKESDDKIDPVIAMTMAFHRCSLAFSDHGGWDFI